MTNPTTILRGIVWLVLALAITFQAQGQSIVFTTLNDGTNGTYAQGISGNQIVGDYYDNNNTFHGFVYDGTNFTTLDPANSQLTQAWGTDGHRVVGNFLDDLGTHGFVWNGTTFITLDEPERIGVDPVTEANGIDGTNIVGFYTSNSTRHGFLYNGRYYFTIDYPNAIYGTILQGINGTNIVGIGYDVAPGNGHSFIYNGQTFTTISNTPGAIDAFGVSGDQISGYYYDGHSDHGFVLEGTNYTTINYPLATLTTAYGIDGNTVVGAYWDNLGTHGFTATLSRPVLLSFARTGNNFVISWPVSLTGWSLQTNVDLINGVWGNYAGPVVNNTVTTQPSGQGNLYFRINHP